MIYREYFGDVFRYIFRLSGDNHIAEEITAIARSLPTHTVVPYRNIPRRYYPKNK